MKKFVMGFCVAGAVAAAVVPASRLGADDAKGHTIKQIMKLAFKDNLTDNVDCLSSKIIKGTATSEDVTQDAALFKELAALTPPRGTPESWKTKTDALLAAIANVQSKPGKESMAAFKAAVSCKECHQVHKAAKKAK